MTRSHSITAWKAFEDIETKIMSADAQYQNKELKINMLNTINSIKK